MNDTPDFEALAETLQTISWPAQKPRPREDMRQRLRQVHDILKRLPDAMPIPCLVAEIEGGAVQTFPLPAERTVIVGRSSQADIVIPNPHLSTRHFSLTVRAGVVTVEDLGSKNGTQLNGNTLSAPSAIRSGDVIETADLRFFPFSYGQGID